MKGKYWLITASLAVLLALAYVAGRNSAWSGLFLAGAALVSPQGVTVDKAGNVYIADSGNSTVEKLAPDGKLTVLAGAPGKNGFSIGKGSDARFSGPTGIAINTGGTLVVADGYNNVIYKVAPNGVVSVLAGAKWSPSFANTKSHFEGTQVTAREFADGVGENARFNHPLGIAVDHAGNVYVADQLNLIIRKITPSGAVTTIAGKAGEAGHADGDKASARFLLPSGVAVDRAGNVYVADTGNHAIRKIALDGTVSTVAGNAAEIGSADGPGASARFNGPRDIAIDGAGNLLVTDAPNQNVRKITPDGMVTTIAGDGSRSYVTTFRSDTGIAVDALGYVYVTDVAEGNIKKISPSGQVEVIVSAPDVR